MRDEKRQRFFLILFLKSSNDLRISVPQTPRGNTITLEVIRDGEKSEFEMTQANMDDPYGASGSALNFLLRGVTIESLRPDLQRPEPCRSRPSGVGRHRHRFGFSPCRFYAGRHSNS